MMTSPLPRIRRRRVVGEGVILSQPMSSDNHRGQPSHLGNIVRLRATTLDRGRSSWAIIPAGSIVSHVFPLSPFLCWPDRNTCVDLPPAGWHSELSSNRIQHLKVFPSTDICLVQPRNAFWGKKTMANMGKTYWVVLSTVPPNFQYRKYQNHLWQFSTFQKKPPPISKKIPS